MWDDRYKVKEFIYGQKPNDFLVQSLNYVGKKVLLPADGEGRNAVFLAKNQREVTSFDGSHVAVKKANEFALENNVSINTSVSLAENFDFKQEYYDTIFLCYFHMTPDLREIIHKKCVLSLKVGGTIILEGFTKEQINYSSGGPKDVSMLFSKEILTKDFKELETITLEEKITVLDQGSYHQGQASIIRYIGRKK